MKKNKKILLKIILLGCIFSMALMGHHTTDLLLSDTLFKLYSFALICRFFFTVTDTPEVVLGQCDNRWFLWFCRDINH